MKTLVKEIIRNSWSLW